MTLPGYQMRTPVPQRQGMGTASLVLGLLALPALLLCGLGMVVALIGLALGIVAATRDGGRGAAIAGIVLSTVALVIGGMAIAWLLHQAAECADRSRYPDDAARQRCVEQEFPFARTTSAP